MIWKPTLVVLFAFLLVACNGRVSPPQDAYNLVTITPLPTPTLNPTPTAVPSGAEGIGLAFFRAWQQRDYLGMYSLLSPQSQALVDSGAFVRRYEEAMATAAVQTISSQPISARQEGARAEFNVRVTWESSLVGNIVRNHTVELAYNQGRWGVVWHEGLILPELAGGNRLHMEYRVPARGNIYDVNGRGLAFQGTAVTLGVVPGRIADEDALLATISPLLNLSPDEVKARYANALPDWYVPLGAISEQEMQANYASLQPYIGAGLVTDGHLTRLYDGAGVAAHVVGYMGAIPAEQVAEYQALGYQGDERVGLAGVESWGERYLIGKRGGVLTVVSPTGEYLSTIQESEARPARSIYTTINYDFQAGVEQALAEAILSHPLAEAGSIVVLDVNTGAVLAMASFPDYNPAIFDSTRPEAAQELAAVLADAGQPLLNRATQGAYPGGSTFKIVTMAAALNSGLYTPETTYTSTGSWERLGPEFIKFDWRQGGHGTVTLRQALTASCNSCFYDVGYNLDELDPFLLPNTARQFGLGDFTGITGVYEASGLIPDPNWKLQTQGEGWVRGDSVNMAIGQGFVLVTPLQMANIAAAIANGGTLYRPTVIDRIGSGGGTPEERWPVATIGQLPLSPEHLQAIREAMFEVANNANIGTATHRFVGLPVPVAGKTGTAETVIDDPHAWFTGYAPAAPYTTPNGEVIQSPQIAIAVQVEFAGEGSAVAAPIFRRVVELYYNITPVAPYPW